MNSCTNTITKKNKNWTEEQDQIIRDWIEKYGEKNWVRLGEQINKTGKQCRDRWVNNLNQNITHTIWTNLEDIQLCQYIEKFRTQWSLISKYFKNRGEAYLKNRFYRQKSKLSKYLKQHLGSNPNILLNLSLIHI
eukprot:TRINITY_DN2067_c0_g1_i5.p1 TRINITY_DN2067_c0_g1~~TRINITY_DN2067_c0_g1_i5.p1  ORF type:complete len:135 (-),score=0.01 TRINITY_DN2067_c0_g1_i5:61-465(-)